MENNNCCSAINPNQESGTITSPQRLTVGYFDYVKMFFNWFFLFRKTYSFKPGLYFTGDTYDKKSPLLVTCNFLTTILLMQRRLKPLNVRLLVIDTNGINVWCSAGKGKFSAQEIINKLAIFDRNILTDSQALEIILPKLSLSGVKLSDLKKNNIKPIIGPVYAKDLRPYLEHQPYKDCIDDIVHFGIKARAYTVVPTVVQFSWYAVLMGLVVFIFNSLFKTGFHWQVIPIAIAISFFYPILFPWLPGRRFATKGISLATILSLYSIYLHMSGIISFSLMFFYGALIFGTSIFLALSYTGNSSVSNYSKVKKEITHFLPVSVGCYIIAIVSYFISGA